MLSPQAALESAKQAIKTAVAGVISLYITDLFHLPQGYWAAITALIVMVTPSKAQFVHRTDRRSRAGAADAAKR